MVIHCHAGLGRTGMFAACMAKGGLDYSSEEAIQWVRESIPGAVEVRDQEVPVSPNGLEIGAGTLVVGVGVVEGGDAAYGELIPRGVEALEASLNKERMAQAVEMFEKLDKNKDGKITDQEVPPAQFKNKAWRQANINGDMILTWEEEMIWQYNYQKKKAGRSK